jgi:hypothetical protein
MLGFDLESLLYDYEIFAQDSAQPENEIIDDWLSNVKKEVASPRESEPSTTPEVMSNTHPQEDSKLSILCQLCRVNAVHTQTRGRKRKLDPILSSMRLCIECKKLKPEHLALFAQADNGKKFAMKRVNAMRRLQESEIKKKLKVDPYYTDKAKEEEDHKKRQQKLKNRVSAQQSRDRKKAYLSELEETNKNYLIENELYKHKIQALEFENKSLRSQLLDLNSQSEESCFVLYIKTLATIISILLLSQSLHKTSLQAKQLLDTLNLNSFTNPHGVSIVQKSNDLIKQFNINIQNLIPEPSQMNRSSIQDLHEDKVRSLISVSESNMSQESLWRNIIPQCLYTFEDQPKKEAASLATVFTKSAIIYHSDEQAKVSPQNIQLILPVSLFPSLQISKDITSNDKVVEFSCELKGLEIKQLNYF